MKKLLFALIAAALPVLAASAADMKIAVIDMGKVFQEYSKTKINEAKLKKMAEVYKDYSMKLAETENKLKEEFKALRDASQNIALSQAERENRRLGAEDKYRQVAAKEQELRDYNREKQAQLRDEYEKMRDEILKEIKLAVSNKCTVEGYTIVLDKSGMTLNNIPTVIYSNPSLDITDSIIKTLNLGTLSPKESETENKDKEKAKK